ncbi:MAG TPA: bifunctional UDP-N-acetylglucosamine diphosphorylase/glucosamine-1-phosphate N-acetyltransferase GlmU [Bacillota bacterium]|nr:bifunctional UDP-N-acetylglucosamine diphosphorylase/glucosamine-1-phosphate N-acetyltransferase GlmU [Bacillota bacterium]
MANRYAIILAAGRGTRMKSSLYKVLHPVLKRPMVQHVVDQLQPLALDEVVTIVGFGAEAVQETLGDQSAFVVQEEQLGTGHAVQQAEEMLQNMEGTTLVVCGDTPLIETDTFQALVDHHEKTDAKATILTAKAPDPTGYGRVIRNKDDVVERIVEHKDATQAELLVNEINTGTYCFDNKALFHALQYVSNDNAQGEYYLPDVIEILKEQSEIVGAYMTPDFEETLGINDRVALSQAENIMKQRVNETHMRNGVTIIDPQHTYIGLDVEIGEDVMIHPGSMIHGKTVIGKNSVIGPNCEISNMHIGERVSIKQSILMDSVIENDVEVGPYAYIRPETTVQDNAKVGHFVEVKKSTIGEGSKVPHLSYIGDTKIGNHVNVGCGTITVNYDGKDKHETIIEDGAFIGCNTNLVAPITIGKDSLVAAGSTVTKNVPKEALAFGRARQANKEGYAKKRKKQDQ